MSKTYNKTNFPTWKQVTVGNLGNAKTVREQLEAAGIKTVREQLEAAGIKIGNRGDDILGRATFENTKATLDLVRVSVKELGLKDGATTAEIYAAAERHGLAVCPAEVAWQLWLQYPDLLPRVECSLVAMEAIVDSDGDRSVFFLGHSVFGRWLDADDGHPGSRWLGNRRWVFVRSSN